MAKDVEIEMVGRISGARDGQDWPAPGGTIKVPSDEAKQLVGMGMAKYPDGGDAEPDVPEAATAPEPETATKPAPKRGSRRTATRG